MIMYKIIRNKMRATTCDDPDCNNRIANGDKCGYTASRNMPTVLCMDHVNALVVSGAEHHGDYVVIHCDPMDAPPETSGQWDGINNRNKQPVEHVHEGESITCEDCDPMDAPPERSPGGFRDATIRRIRKG